METDEAVTHAESPPSFIDVLFHGFHIMTENLVAEKLRRLRPTIYIRPEITNVRVLEFYKARQVFTEAQPAKRRLLKALRRHAVS